MSAKSKTKSHHVRAENVSAARFDNQPIHDYSRLRRQATGRLVIKVDSGDRLMARGYYAGPVLLQGVQ